MAGKYPIYKGLQKPLIFRGFKGRFIVWGIASLVLGLVLGGVTVAVFNMYAGAVLTISLIAGGLVTTYYSQKRGLYSKSRKPGIFIYGNKLKISYETKKEAVRNPICRNR